MKGKSHANVELTPDNLGHHHIERRQSSWKGIAMKLWKTSEKNMGV